MAAEIDDCDFYREDFSAQSDWEVLNAQMCEILQKWNVSNDNCSKEFLPQDLYRCEWVVQKEELNYLTEKIIVTYYKAHLDNVDILESSVKTASSLYYNLLTSQNLFCVPVPEVHSSDIPLLAQLYHLQCFILVQLTENNNRKSLSDFNVYMNTISVVISEVNSSVPIFLQLYESQWSYFIGFGVSHNMQTNFDVVNLNKSPKECRYLSGLLKMFNEKIRNNYKRPTVISVKTTYSMGEVKIRVPMYVPLGMKLNACSTENKEEESFIIMSQFVALPHGYVPNTRTEMYAIFIWPAVAANTIIDSALQTHLTPMNAPYAYLYQTVYASSYLSLCLKDYLQLNETSSTLESYIGRDFRAVSENLMKINSIKIHSHWQIKDNMEYEKNPKKKIPGPICDYELNQMLYYLFPDMHPDDPLFPYQELKAYSNRIKSATPDSLVQRLSCLLSTCYAHFGGESGMAQLWAAFLREVSNLWNYNLFIPGVNHDYPDPKTCLLHQKLQLLNVCILGRLQQHNVLLDNASNSVDSFTNDEEEFFDCVDTDNRSNYDDDENKTMEDCKIVKSEGRLKRLGNLKLLNGDEYLYVPITQKVPPKTEDQLPNDSSYINEVTKADEGSAMAQIMHSCLFSDMESFKAANINGTMEDFIRWYSPNDWEQFENESGEKIFKLSARMSTPNNTWLNMWLKAKPIPAHKQKSLFDASEEGIKVLQYLEQVSLRNIYQLTVVPLIHSSILKLENIFMNCNVFDIMEVHINDLLNDLCSISRDVEIFYTERFNKIQFPNCLPLIEKIEKLERIFYQYKCFQQFFSKHPEGKVKANFQKMLQNGGVCGFCNNIETKLSDTMGEDFVSTIRSRLNGRSLDENLISKDYIIRLGCLTSNNSGNDFLTNVNAPQFLRATVTGDRLRLCGAFTENILSLV